MLPAQDGNDVKPGHQLIMRIGISLAVRLDYLRQPVGQAFGHGRCRSRHRRRGGLGLKLDPLVVCLLARLPVHPAALTRPRRGGHPHVGCITAAVGENPSLAVRPAPGPAGHRATSASCSSSSTYARMADAVTNVARPSLTVFAPNTR